MKATLTIEMPNSCVACPCYSLKAGVCNAAWRAVVGQIAHEARPVWCPLVEVIEPIKVHYTLTGPAMGVGQYEESE